MYIENNRKVLLFSQVTGNVDTGTTSHSKHIAHTRQSTMKIIYFRKRQSSELSGSIARVSSLLVRELVSRNGVLGALPIPACQHSGGALSASWTPGVYKGSWGSLNLRDPDLTVRKQYSTWIRRTHTSRCCSISYSKKMSDSLVVNRIHGRNTLILCICKVDNRSGSENWRCEVAKMKNEGPHSHALSTFFRKLVCSYLYWLEGKVMSQNSR